VKLAQYHRGDAYLPVDTYRRGAHEITLIGMVHIAPQPFFASVGELLDQHVERGDRVLVEGVGVYDPDEHPADHLSEFDQALMAEYGRLKESQAAFIRMMAEGLGVVSQLEAIPHWFGWERADIDALQMMRLSPGMRATEIDPDAEAALRWAFEHKPRVARAIYDLLRNVPRLALLTGPFQAMGTRGSVVLSHRNRVAILEALSSKRNAVLPWGAAHLPGMGKLLRGNGFEHVNRSWLLAMPWEFPGGGS
jgi:hypothetical protein